METIYAKLNAIQSALKAPKTQENKFGGYKYRKAEDILESVKPLLKANGCTLTCTDELTLIGERYYIKATATITAIEDGSSVSTTAYAREELTKKGMDESQVTGASSSYARKYALNGLLCIDDTADSDTTNVGDSTEPEKNYGRTKKTPSKPVEKAVTTPTPEKNSGTPDMRNLLPGGPDYKKVVSLYAKGKLAKSGEDYRTVWSKMVNAGEDLLEVFDHDVATFKLENNIQPEF